MKKPNPTAENVVADVVDRATDEADEDNSDADNYDHLTQFAPLIAAMNLERLPQFALSVRMCGTLSKKLDMSICADTDDSPMTCAVLSPPLAGSYNIIFRLQFSDGVLWIFKVPVTGYHARFDELAAQALTSEAMTMRLVKRDTTIPVPEVYLFDASFNNEISCPFIMMEYLQGRPLHELWFQKWSSEVALKQFRTRVLEELAAAMAQLNAFKYSEGGSLLFDRSGSVTGIGPIRSVDVPAQLDRLNRGDYDDSALYCVKGPFQDSRSFLKFTLDRQDHRCSGQDPPRKYLRGVRQLLRLFIDWIPTDGCSMSKTQFVLSHPDFALQNILVSEDGAVLGIIDWDGAGAVPGCIAHYPLWLMRNWDPLVYNYDSEEGKMFHEDGPPEDTPEQLAFWRTTYAQSLEEHSLGRARWTIKDSDQDGSNGTVVSNQLSDVMMPRSPLFWSLAVAADNPMSLHEILGLIFSEIERLTAPKWDKGHSDHKSLSTTSGGGSSCCFKPICYRMQEVLRYVARYLRKHEENEYLDEKSPKNLEFPSATVELYPSKSTQSHHSCIRNASNTTIRFLHKKSTNGKDMKPQPAMVALATGGACQTERMNAEGGHTKMAIKTTLGSLHEKEVKCSGSDGQTQSTLVKTRTSDNSKASHRRSQKTLHDAVRLMGEKKTETPGPDTHSHLVPQDACSNEEDNPPRGRIQRVFQESLGLLHNTKARISIQEVKPPPAINGDSTDNNNKPGCGRVRNTIHCAFPCLRKSKMESFEAQEKPCLAKNQVDHLCGQFMRKFVNAGFSVSKVGNRRTSFDAATKKAAKGSEKTLSRANENRPASEAPGSMEDGSSVFAQWNVADALVDNNLSEKMMQRLKEGFDALVASAV